MSAREGDGGRIDTDPIDAGYCSETPSPESFDRAEDSRAFGGSDALEWTLEAARAARTHLDDDHEVPEAGDEIEFQVAHAHVVSEDGEPLHAEIVRDG